MALKRSVKIAKKLGWRMRVKIGDGLGNEALTTIAELNSKFIAVNNLRIDVKIPCASLPTGWLFADV